MQMVLPVFINKIIVNILEEEPQMMQVFLVLEENKFVNAMLIRYMSVINLVHIQGPIFI